MFNWKILIILFLAAFLRCYQLNSVPPSLDWDEAAIGWNAKTIFHTRRDEFGTRLPFTFKSFGDYKAPVYIYLTAPIVGIFGANAISVRLVSVIAGVISIYLIYLLGVELKSSRLGLIAAGLLAITPWSLMMSRPAFEPNLALMFILLGIDCLFLALKKPAFFILSALSLAFSLYTYHSPKIFVPLLLLGFIIIYRSQLFSLAIRKWLIGFIILLAIFSFPLIKDMASVNGGARFQGTSIFYTPTGELKPLNLQLATQLIKNYAVHFSPKFLFFGGAKIPRVQMKEVGPLLLIEAPFLLIGLFYLLKNKQKNWVQFLFWWLMIGSLPAVVGYEIPHLIRTYNLLPALLLITALGVNQVKSPKFQLIIFIIFIFNFSYFIYHYFVSYPIYSAPDWQYGYEIAATEAKKHEDQVSKIIITSYYGQPYVFTYFYQNRDPLKIFWGEMSKYLFRKIKLPEDAELKNVLLIGSPEEISADTPGLIKTINYPNNQPVFRLVLTKP